MIELMVALVILGITMTGIADLYYNMQAAQSQNQHYDLAVRAARTEIEVLRNNSYNSLTPGTPIDFTSSLPSALPPDRKGTVAVSQPTAGLRRVDVTITYTDFGQAENIELSSDIGVIGIGQGQ